MSAIRAMAAALRRLTELDPGYLAVNVSPGVLVDPRTAATLADVDPRRVVREITQHDLPADADALHAIVRALRLTGVRVAVDDVGAGYSGLSRLLSIAPDIIKLDRDITSNVARDPARQAMVTAAVTFCNAVGATLVAEGIEVVEDCQALRRLGVGFGQGYLLGRPLPLP